MARESKAERLAREAAELKAYDDENALAYPARLMAALERATNYHFQISVRSETFMVRDLNDPFDTQFDFTWVWDNLNQADLEELEFFLDKKDAEVAEMARIAKVRDVARQKAKDLFTQEERDVLGI
jgi:hypothetical protein